MSVNTGAAARLGIGEAWPDGPSLVHRALRDIAGAPTPGDAALAVLTACVDATGAAGGRVHLLNLSKGRYMGFPFREPASAAPLAGTLDIPASRIMSAAAFAGAEHDGAVDGLAVCGFRGRSCVGAIALDGPRPEDLPDGLARDLVAASDLLVPIFEDHFALNLLDSLQAPALDFSQSEEDFFADVGLLIGVSSGMEFAVLRELDDGELRCTTLWGMAKDADQRDWDLRPAEDFPPFDRVLRGETVRIRGLADPDAALLRKRRRIDPIRSFVATPVRVGMRIFGVLTFGARCDFDYAPLELRGFASIANGIGVSIENFRNSHELVGRVGTYREAALAITAIEVAQAARHEAAGRLDTCHWRLASLDRKLGRHAPTVEDEMRAISTELQRVNDALNTIRSAARPPDRTIERIPLRRVWDEARAAVAGRLSELRVSAQYSGPDVEVDASPDWLRQVFLNLMLNSIDAFRDAKKSGRRIELAVERPSDRAISYSITYRDTATGINPQRLHVPEEYREEPLAQVIFKPSVTSKPAGSGFGLWLVRRILADHYGSIDLVDHRQGVTFAIALPKPTDMKERGTA